MDEKKPLLRSNSSQSSSRSTSVASSPTHPPPGPPIVRHLPGRATKLFATLCILLTELCERLTFYGLTANLLLFCKDMLDFKVPLPTTVNLIFQGTCYFTPMLFGWIADSFWGRYNTIYISSLVYTVGTFLIIVVAADDNLKPKHNIYYRYMGCPDKKDCINSAVKITFFSFGLLLIALGTGGIKANVSPFGADQVQSDSPRAVQRFFNWFYWFINIGSFIAFTGVVYVQQYISFFYGYGIIIGLSILLTVIMFLLGRNKYIAKPPGGSVLVDTLKIIGQALKKKRNSINGYSHVSWLDRARVRYEGSFSDSQVEDVWSLLRLFPVFLMFIMYWTIYSQMQTSYLIQGTYMRLNIGAFKVPVASLSIFDIIIVLTLIPIMDKVLYPLIRYCGINFSPLRRIGVGMLFAAASVLVAGIVEIYRRNDDHFKQLAFGKYTNASNNVNVFYQAPQFLLIGTSEVLTSIAGMEFAYSQAPRCLQGLVMRMFLVTTGLGSYVAMALVNIVRAASKKMYPDNLNHGRLEWYFFLLSGLMMLNFFIYLKVAADYKYVRHPRDRYSGRNGSSQENVDSDVYDTDNG